MRNSNKSPGCLSSIIGIFILLFIVNTLSPFVYYAVIIIGITIVLTFAYKLINWLVSKIKLYKMEKELQRINSDLDNVAEQINKMYDCEIVKQQTISYNNYDSMSGHEFENFCSDLLKKNGFQNVEVTRGSGDHGIDILAEKDGITYAIQCKCYSSNIGNAAVQQAHTGKSLYHKDIAVVMTNRYFTAQAKQEAQALGVKLWDRDKLNELIENN